MQASKSYFESNKSRPLAWKQWLSTYGFMTQPSSHKNILNKVKLVERSLRKQKAMYNEHSIYYPQPRPPLPPYHPHMEGRFRQPGFLLSASLRFTFEGFKIFVWQGPPVFHLYTGVLCCGTAFLMSSDLQFKHKLCHYSFEWDTASLKSSFSDMIHVGFHYLNAILIID